MLVISRKENESITIELVEGLDPSLTLREAFAHGPIVLTLTHVGLRRVRIAIEAPPALRIGRRGPQPGEQHAPVNDNQPSSSTLIRRRAGTP